MVSYEEPAKPSTPVDESFRPLSRYGWFPTIILKIKRLLAGKSFRPLSRYGWFPTKDGEGNRPTDFMFQSPLEVWVVSYLTQFMNTAIIAGNVSVPSRGMGGFLLISIVKYNFQEGVSVPSRGMGGFLPE